MVKFRDLLEDETNSDGGAYGNRTESSTQEKSMNFRCLTSIKPGAERETDEIRKALYDEAFDYLRHVYDAVKRNTTFKTGIGFGIVENIVEAHPSPDPLLIKAIHNDEESGFLIRHGVNVAIYAVKIGKSLGWRKEKLVEIGLAGLLHDVGMALIPEEIIYKVGKLDRKELDFIRKNPDYGYEILQSPDSSYPYLAECAIQSHERTDGSGYPQGLKGVDIHEYARIIGIAEVYEALTHSRPYREKGSPFSAVKEIIRSEKNHFDKQYLKALLNTFSVFPIFSCVRLNSRAVGKVIETYPDYPLRPKLQILYNSRGRKLLSEQIVNLPDNSLLHSVDSVSREEIGDWVDN